MKRVVSFLLAMVLLVSLIPASTAVYAADSKLIAITFDDGPCAHTTRLLDGLAQRGVNVTFFTVGTGVANYPNTVKRAYQSGHQIANHSYNHPELTALSNSEVINQVSRTSGLLDQICGKGTSYFFRAPYGSTSSRVRSLIGMPLILWSVDTVDWKYRNSTTVKNNIVNNAHDGAIVLLHDIHATTIDGALAGIDILLAQGYELVTVTELFRRRGVTPYSGTSYSQCRDTGADYGSITEPVITTAPEGHRQRVTMTAPQGSRIYYSLDGSDINQESKLYTGPILVDPPCTLKAVAAYNLNGDRSKTVTKQISLPAAPAPTFQIEGDSLTIISAASDTHIYYTLDGSTPTTGAAPYTTPIKLQPDTVVRAIATGTAYLPSAVSSAYFSLQSHFFLDVFPQDWFCSAIDLATTAGYMNGIGNYRFAPRSGLTRGQFVTLLYRYAQAACTEQMRETIPFDDLNRTAYYFDPVCWAYENGIVNGYNAEEFRPEAFITRQEMCKILSVFLTCRGKQLPEASNSVSGYADYNSIHHWALPHVDTMTSIGLFQGDNDHNFRPTANAERAHAATVLLRLADLEPNLPDLPQAPQEEPADPVDNVGSLREGPSAS